ncbi:MAG: hypothetical protein ACRD4M_03670, partial [Candidatus Acidiferrales bacterium]
MPAHVSPPQAGSICRQWHLTAQYVKSTNPSPPAPRGTSIAIFLKFPGSDIFMLMKTIVLLLLCCAGACMAQEKAKST